ncbi:hypothetical protein B0H19DRAFT_1258620 [Mycena capillaripes]|nr:hypothetical protein B0H19DRAFT_1258620 [Mycena capillaripes]
MHMLVPANNVRMHRSPLLILSLSVNSGFLATTGIKVQPFTEQAPSPLSAPPGSEKMLAWSFFLILCVLTRPTRVDESHCHRHFDHQPLPASASVVPSPPSSVAAPSLTVTFSARDRVLEDRIAQLEHIAPPPLDAAGAGLLISFIKTPLISILYSTLPFWDPRNIATPPDLVSALSSQLGITSVIFGGQANSFLN